MDVPYVWILLLKQLVLITADNSFRSPMLLHGQLLEDDLACGISSQTPHQPRSRRPNTSPFQLPAELVERIVNLRDQLHASGLGAGPATIAWHLHHHAGIATPTSRSTTTAGGVRHGGMRNGVSKLLTEESCSGWTCRTGVTSILFRPSPDP